MRSLTSLSLAFFFSYVAAQAPATLKVIPFSTLPQCAQICPALNAANDVCVPPAVPETNEDTYTACICSSQQLAGFQTTPNSICTDVCTAPADLEAIQSALNTLCNVVAPQDPNPNPNPTDANPAGPSNTGRPIFNNNDDRPWISTHWQWIIFAVVLVLGMIGFSILGVWLKRRHRRRVGARTSNLASTDAIPPAGGAAAAATAASSNRSLPATAHGSTHTREMTQSPSGMGMASGVAPPRRTFTGRSRSSTVNSHSGPVVWGPHQNMAATRPYDNVPPSPVYAGAGGADDYDDRGGHVYTDNSVHNAPPSPISPSEGGSESGYPAHNFSRKNTNGAGAQRIREMRSQESVERSRSRGGAGTPNSASGRR